LINALSFDIEDWFQVENLRSVIPKGNWDRYELRVERNTLKILEILRKHNAKATFFILGWIAERCPDLIRRISREGNEIASHGYSHELIYNQTQSQFEGDLLRSKRVLEEITGKEVLGYRASNFSITQESIWAIDILKKCGFKYDSSIFPISFHDRYGFKGVNSRPFIFDNGLIEVPLSTIRVFNVSLPLAGGGYFRLLPYSYFRYFFKKLNKNGESFVFFLHPWEFDYQQPRVEISYKYKFRHYHNLSKTEIKLRRLLLDFEFGRIGDLLVDQMSYTHKI